MTKLNQLELLKASNHLFRIYLTNETELQGQPDEREIIRHEVIQLANLLKIFE